MKMAQQEVSTKLAKWCWFSGFCLGDGAKNPKGLMFDDICKFPVVFSGVA